MENTDSKPFIDILKYCIASVPYKRTDHRAERFLNAIEEVDLNDLLKILERSHLLGLFYDDLQQLNKEHPLIEVIYPFVVCQELVIDNLLEELQLISQRLAKHKIKPVLLKAPSLWSEIYDPFYLRRSNDIDLLVDNLKDLDIIHEELTTLKYATHDDYTALFHGAAEYELSQYLLKKVIKVEPETARLLDIAKEKFKVWNFNKIETGVYSFLVYLDFQKAFFKLEDGSFPVPQEAHLQNCKIVEGYGVLTDAANLPYLASKFIIDNQIFENGNKGYVTALKLVGDFVRLIGRANQETIAESIELAQKWGSLKSYALVLNSCDELIPEVSFEELDSSSDVDILAVYISLLVDKYVVNSEVQG